MADIAEVIDLLERDEGLELGESPWGTYEEGEQPYSIDWDRLLPPGGVEGQREFEPWMNSRLKELEREFEEILGQEEDPDIGKQTEGGVIWDTCAWYQPIHFFAYDWGIFVREDCMLSLAKRIARRADWTRVNADKMRYRFALAPTFIRAAFLVLYYHEHFHHRVECLGLRLHVVLQRPRYPNYTTSVYKASRGTDDLLEEALANAHSYLAILFYRGPCLPPSFREAIRTHLLDDFPSNPPGYRRAVHYLTRPSFDDGENLLQGQVNEAALTPTQPHWHWNVAPRLTQSFFNIKSNIWTVVPTGTSPILPTSALPYTCSTADMAKIYKAAGYMEDRTAGKGSHIKLKKPGKRPMILPNRKDLSPGVLNAALKELGGYRPEDIHRLLKAAQSLRG